MQGWCCIGWAPCVSAANVQAAQWLAFSEQGLLSHALSVLPIERPVLSILSEAPTDEKSVTESKFIPRGSPEVVYSYEAIRYEKLKSVLSNSNVPVGEGRVLSWVEQWNQLVHMNCSSANLQNVLFPASFLHDGSSVHKAFIVPHVIPNKVYHFQFVAMTSIDCCCCLVSCFSLYCFWY